MSAPGGFVDTNYRVVPGGTVDLEPEVIDPPDGWRGNDTVKLSRGEPIHLANKIVFNRTEDCVDGVGVRHGLYERFTLYPLRTGITLKGAAADNTFSGLCFQGAGELDIELGQFDNYWFPGRAPTRRNTFRGIGRIDGRPVRVRLWDADDSNVFAFGSGVSVRRVPKAVWLPYFLFRFVQLRLTNLWLRLQGKPAIKTEVSAT